MEDNKKDLKKWIILILIVLTGYWLINNLSTVGILFDIIINILFPFILGGCLAFILNIPMAFFEKKLTKPNKKSKKEQNKKLLRMVSIIFAIVIILIVLILVITLIVPELMGVVNLFIDNIPYYAEEITKLAEQYGINILDINTMIEEANIDMEAIKNQVTTLIPSVLTSSLSLVSSIISGISNFVIAIIFAIYILIDKEKLKSQATRILYAYLKKERAEKIINVGKVSRDTFKNFFTVQCLEATILGTLCIIGMLILRIPYSVPVGVLIGVTALIPVVGAFIGIAIGAILIVAVNPIKVITFIIFVLILQQIEGNVIYPRVVGTSVGLPGMWVLFGVTVGGSLGGILGMLLGVPVATIIYRLLKNHVNDKIHSKKELENSIKSNSLKYNKKT